MGLLRGIMDQAQPVRVFISYSHDDDAHVAEVLALAQTLRRSGVDAWIDRFEPDPRDGWATWMREQIRLADRILIVPSETWLRRFEGRERPDVGKGVRWEGLILTDRIYHARSPEKPIRAVLVGNARTEFIPDVIGTHTFYRGAEDFLRHLRGEARVIPSPLSALAVAEVTRVAGGTSSRRELEDFLKARFNSDELDRFLSYGQESKTLRDELPKPGVVGKSSYVSAYVDLLLATGEITQPWLWDQFRRDRSMFSEQWDALQAQWR